MAITALPEQTVQLLGSAQVLTTPTSLIKELIDNSLDAKATSIDILISPNTLDKIEVRDNGHGIPQEDLDALGRRGHTSKLRSFEELRFLGGVTLGFRGEALASAVQLGEVSITTRTDGESVATKVKLKAPGGIEQQTRTSHPVGTTVTVVNFMSKLPVRKKMFEKESAKSLHRMNQLLQAYALARPSIKFSLKVMKGGRGSWSYSPRPSGDIKGAVSQIFGRDAAMQCVEKLLDISENLSGGSFSGVEDILRDSKHENTLPTKSPSQAFKVEAFLPMAGADPSKIGSGQYVSIDARPVSHDKGTVKKLVTLFKKYFRNSMGETVEKVKNPFIRLNISCPVASYDANVEPAKDDVLFGNEQFVLESVERLLKDVYGECNPEPPATTRRQLAQNLDDFELLLARKPTPAPPKNSLSERSGLSQITESLSHPSILEPIQAGQERGEVSANNENMAVEFPGGRAKRWGFDMSTDYAEEVEGYERRDKRRQNTGRSTAKSSEVEEPSNSRSEMNPWVIAKMTGSTDRNLDSSSSGSAARSARPGNTDPYATPRSRQTFRADDIRALQPDPLTLFSGQDSSNQMSKRSLPGFSRPVLPITLDLDDREGRNPVDRYEHGESNNIGPLLISPPSTLDSKRARGSRGLNRPFVSHVKPAREHGTSRELVQSKLSLAQIPPESDLAWAMDFEERKETATRRRREELRIPRSMDSVSQSTETVRSSPHQNRYNAAIASLETGNFLAPTTVEKEKEKFKTSLPEDDPRAYLMKRKKSMQPSRPGDPPKQMRAKSMRLPMERIPRDGELYPLIKNLSTDMEILKVLTKALLKEDVYVSRGNHLAGLAISPVDSAGVLQRLQRAVEAWAATGGGEDYEVEFTCGNLTNDKVMGMS